MHTHMHIHNLTERREDAEMEVISRMEGVMKALDGRLSLSHGTLCVCDLPFFFLFVRLLLYFYFLTFVHAYITLQTQASIAGWSSMGRTPRMPNPRRKIFNVG